MAYQKFGTLPVKSHDALGQFSYAPAIQTTVVTTTTTTTTAFPPFAVPAPRGLQELDPEQYPLAFKPTPLIIRKLQFDVNGKSAYFEEAEDPELRVQELSKQYASLATQQGTLRNVTKFSGNSDPRTQPPKRAMKLPKSVNDHHSWNEPLMSITPSSTPETDVSSSRARHDKKGEAPVRSEKEFRAHPLHQSQDSRSASETCDESEQDLNNDLETVMAHPIRRRATSGLRKGPARYTAAHLDVAGLHAGRLRAMGGSVAPPGTEDNYEPLQVTRIRREPRRRSVVPCPLNTSPVLDASLPSPILSPVTAAANLVRSVASLAADETEDESEAGFPTRSAMETHRILSIPPQIDMPKVHDATFDNSQLPTPSLTDISGMIDSFDAMPQSMKTYLMYQFLRRCNKPTIKFVAEVVNPTLKCDFFARLPLELSYNILHYLDVRSMCSAAQVSKKWRRTVDSDEKAWKDLLDTDGFKLAPGEIQRAVQEGWGWQYPTGEGEWERDVNPDPHRRFDQRVLAAQSLMPDRYGFEEHMDSAMSSSRKRKLKVPNRSASQKKQKKKVSLLRGGKASGWFGVEGAQGPNAYASAAAAYIPDPQIGLPSLRNLHLFKSLYVRHHRIRKNWMNPETKPLHLAFRAHQRHVVTCLQFDADKILTGSDDANIDIYDTKTGASIKQLHGHEGGVWALQYEGNTLVSGSTDRTVRIWNIEEGRCLQVWQGHTSTVRCLQVVHPAQIGLNADGSPLMMPKQSLIITGSRDSSCRVWKLPSLTDPSVIQSVANDAQNPYFVQALPGHHHSVRAIAAHGDTLVSGSYDATVRVWKISTGETLHRLTGHQSKVYSVVLDHERGRCISGSMDSFVKVWSLETGSCLLHLEGHTSLVGLLDLKDNYLVSAAADATLRIWDPDTGRIKQALAGHLGAITCFSHDGEKIVSGSDSTLKMWNTTNGEFVRDLLTDLSGVWQVRFDDRRCIAAVHRNGWTYIELLDFGASRDGVHESQLGRRIVVDHRGREVLDEDAISLIDPAHA